MDSQGSSEALNFGSFFGKQKPQRSLVAALNYLFFRTPSRLELSNHWFVNRVYFNPESRYVLEVINGRLFTVD